MSNELLIACVIVGVDLTHLLVRKEGVVALLLGLWRREGGIVLTVMYTNLFL